MAREIKRRNFITWVTETSDDGLFRVEKGSPIITLGDKSWKVFNFLREYVWGLVESDLKCRNFWRVVVVEEVLEGKYVFVSVETCGLEIAKDECLGAKRLTVRTLLSMLTFFFDQRVERFVADQNMPCYETYLSRANATLYHRIIYDDLHLGTFLLLTHPMFYSEIQFFHLCLKILQIYQDQDNIREYEKDVSMDGTVSDCDDWANLLATSTSQLIKRFLMKAGVPSEELHGWEYEKDVCCQSEIFIVLPDSMDGIVTDRDAWANLLATSASKLIKKFLMKADPKDGENSEKALKIIREKLPDILGEVHYELSEKLVHEKLPYLLGNAA